MNNTKKKISTRDLAGAALFTAISVISTRFLSLQLTPDIRIGIGPLPLMLVGLIYGPVLGGISGFVADIVGMMINPMGGAFHPGFSLSAILAGAIPGILMKIFIKDERNRLESPKMNTVLLLSVLIIYYFVHLILNSYWVTTFTGNPLTVSMIRRLPKIVAESIVCFILLKLIIDQVFKKLEK